MNQLSQFKMFQLQQVIQGNAELTILLPTVVVGLCAKLPSSLSTSSFNYCSSTGSTHSLTETVSAGQRFPRSTPLSLTKCCFPSSYN